MFHKVEKTIVKNFDVKDNLDGDIASDNGRFLRRVIKLVNESDGASIRACLLP